MNSGSACIIASGFAEAPITKAVAGERVGTLFTHVRSEGPTVEEVAQNGRLLITYLNNISFMGLVYGIGS